MNFVAPIRDRMGRTFGLPVILACAILLGSSAGWSQTSGSTDEALEQQYEEAFQELFRDPGDLEKTFKFAELAVKVGNYETAISALERMLLVNPNLPRVRLELGVLYFRLGSYQAERSTHSVADRRNEVHISDLLLCGGAAKGSQWGIGCAKFPRHIGAVTAGATTTPASCTARTS